MADFNTRSSSNVKDYLVASDQFSDDIYILFCLVCVLPVCVPITAAIDYNNIPNISLQRIFA